MKAMLVKKLGMATVFDKNSQAVTTTVLEALPNTIVEIKRKNKEGYNALKLGYPRNSKKAILSVKATNKETKAQKLRFEKLKEWRVEEIPSLKVSEKIEVDIFEEGEKIAVTGISKGKGFAGVIKKHGFSRGPETHGSGHHRGTGSIGSMFPQKVFKGKKMPGRLGGAQVTVKNLQILKIDPKSCYLILKGATPGGTGSIIFLRGGER